MSPTRGEEELSVCRSLLTAAALVVRVVNQETFAQSIRSRAGLLPRRRVNTGLLEGGWGERQEEGEGGSPAPGLTLAGWSVACGPCVGMQGSYPRGGGGGALDVL